MTVADIGHIDPLLLFRVREHPVQLYTLPSCDNDEYNNITRVMMKNSGFWRKSPLSIMFSQSTITREQGLLVHWYVFKNPWTNIVMKSSRQTYSLYNMHSGSDVHDKHTLCSVHCQQWGHTCTLDKQKRESGSLHYQEPSQQAIRL